MGSVLLAYSGGVDSTFLLKVAKEVLKDKVLAVTASSPAYPQREINEAKRNAQKIRAEHLIIKTEELNNEDFASNPPQRCYYCKKELFGKLLGLAKRYKLNQVVDAENCDDSGDFRPGIKAGRELNIRSPLKEAGLTKREIRLLSKKMRLLTWDKPSYPCLSTRFPYGMRITRKELRRVEQAEELLRSLRLPIKQFRVRMHGNLARIEVLKEDLPLFVRKDVSKRIVDGLKSLGYLYISLDLQGYRMGSMNEVLEEKMKYGQGQD